MPVSGTEPPHLRPRERECLRLLALGYSPPQVADQLGLAPSTVNGYLDRAYGRLNVMGRVDAFRVLGWLQVPAS